MADKPTGGKSLPERDRRTIERGMRAHHRLLVAWLTKKFGDNDLAQDLAQETYLRVWQYAEQHEVQHLKPLLFKTAANLAANEFRSRKRWRSSAGAETGGLEAQDVEYVACDAPSPERIAVARAEAKASLEAISQLPEQQRRAFVMNRFEGKSYAEISAALGVSVSSVEKYIMAALTALRKAGDRQYSRKNILPFPTRADGNGRK
jgi:RNA polymerase sigma factor (sigma-70 family)